MSSFCFHEFFWNFWKRVSSAELLVNNWYRRKWHFSQTNDMWHFYVIWVVSQQFYHRNLKPVAFFLVLFNQPVIMWINFKEDHLDFSSQRIGFITSLLHLLPKKQQKQDQPLEGVLKISCSATVLKQLNADVEEFLNKDASLQPKMNQKWTPLGVFFKYFDHISRRATLQKRFLVKRLFCKTPLSGCFFILCFLLVKHSKSRCFFNIFIRLYLTTKNVMGGDLLDLLH